MAAKLSGSGGGKYTVEANAEINVTPFVDIMLVLLIIFMVAAPLATVSVPVKLPRAVAPPGKNPPTPVFISIQNDGDVWIGDLLFVCASICWSAYSVTVRRFGLDAARATMAITAFALVSFGPLFSLLVLLNILPSHFSQASWTEILLQVSFQGVGSVAISGITFTQMIRSYGPVKSTMITAVVPGLSALGAVIILGEPMSWNLMVGLALVTCGILFGVRQAMVKT